MGVALLGPFARAGRALSRRGLFAGAVAAGGIATGAAAMRLSHRGSPRSAGFYGAHQAGIGDPPLPYLTIAGFDVLARDRTELAGILRTWTAIAVELTGLGALTLTVGFGPALFTDDRYGFAPRRPAALALLPPFPGESLDPAAGNGDLCVQACAADPMTAHYAVRTLLRAARPHAVLRWRQTGFRPAGTAPDPRGLLGFRDGTENLDATDPAGATALWAGPEPAWMRGGTYLVVRRIRLLLDTWDRVPLPSQEAGIGRERDSNRRLDPVPGNAHAHLAAAERNGGARILRRSYSYDVGADPNGLLDSGLVFICFQRDPRRQFVPIQRRLAASDALNAFSQHLSSGVYACPPGCREDSWLGAELFS